MDIQLQLPASSSLFTLLQCSVRSYCSQSSPFPVLLSETFCVTEVYLQMVSSKCSCSLSPLLWCLCLLKRNQVSNLDQTAVTKRTLAQINMTIVLSADAAWPVVPHVYQLSCERTLAAWLFISFLFCCFHFVPLGFFVLFFKKQLLPASYFLSAYGFIITT